MRQIRVDEACLLVKSRAEDGGLAPAQSPPLPGRRGGEDADQDQIDGDDELEPECHKHLQRMVAKN